MVGWRLYFRFFSLLGLDSYQSVSMSLDLFLWWSHILCVCLCILRKLCQIHILNYLFIKDLTMNTNKKTINETDLKQMIKESIEEVLTGFDPNLVWGDPNSQARQFGDVWLFKTYELLDEMGISCKPHKLRELLKPIVLEILIMDKEMKKK